MIWPLSRRGETLLAIALCAVVGAVWMQLPIPLIAVVVALVPVAAYLTLAQPFWICLLFVLISFFRIHEAVPQLFDLKLPQLLALGALGGLAFHWLTGGLKIYLTNELLVFLAFVLMVFISAVLSSMRPVSFAYFNSTFIKIVIMTFAITWMCDHPRHFRAAVVGILAAGVLVAGIAVFNKLNGIGLVEGTRVTIGREIDSVLGDPNDLATVLLFPLSFAGAVLLTPGVSRWGRLLGFVAMLIICWGAMATQSRGGLLGLLAVFGVFAWYRIKNRVLMIGAAVAVAAVVYALSGTGERTLAESDQGTVDMSAQGRLDAWHAATRMALRNPLTGIGLDTFLYNYFDYTPHWDGRPHAVHSSWFGVLGEIGFIGFFLFVALNLLVVRRVWRINTALSAEPDADTTLRVTALALLAGLAGNMVSGTFLTHAFIWPFYILMALTLALARYYEQHTSQAKNFRQVGVSLPLANTTH